MAGIRHHILPRFLLRGFASQINGTKVFTWVYRKNSRAFEASTKDVSVEKYFYGKDGEANADPEITELEIEFSALLSELREYSSKEEVTDPRVAEFIAHLCIRTKHLRDSLRESTEFLLESLEEYLSDFRNLKGLILHDPQIMENAFEAKIKDFQMPRHQKDMIMALLPSMASTLLDQQKSEFQFLAKAFFAQIQETLPTMLRDTHITTLSKESIPEPRVGNYRSLKWFVRHSKVPLILGDVGCLFEVSGNRYTSLDSKDELKNVFLPISSHQILVGTSSNFAQKINFQSLKKAYVKRSREYFICSESSTEMASLASSIGEDAEIVSKTELEQIVKEILLKKKP